MNSIFSFFSHSSVKTAELREIEIVLHEPLLKLQRATDSRWLSHQNAIDSLRRCLKSVKLHVVLEEKAASGDATAIDLSLELCKTHVIAMLLLLSDILGILGNLSLVLFRKTHSTY